MLEAEGGDKSLQCWPLFYYIIIAVVPFNLFAFFSRLLSFEISANWFQPKDSALRMQLSLSFDREKSGNKKTSPKIIPYIIILVIETEDGKGSEWTSDQP